MYGLCMIRAGKFFRQCRIGTMRILSMAALGAALAVQTAPVGADDVGSVQTSFDTLFGTEMRGPPVYSSIFERQLAAAAEASQGRIGVAAVDLRTGRSLGVLGDQRFPMASTSKVAIAATFLDGVDKGKWSLTSEFPMLMPVRSAPFSSPVAPVREGQYLTAAKLLELMLTRSNNYATDGLLRVVGGPDAVNAWVRKAGVADWHLDRDIATLVRDDGALDPARVIDTRDSATPMAQVELLRGLYEGKWLSKRSRDTLISIMGRCVTGSRRIRAGLPDDAIVHHKTGSLHNTSSDIGIVETADGDVFAVAIYVTGQGTRLNRENRIADIARTVYNGYLTESSGARLTAAR